MPEVRERSMFQRRHYRALAKWLGQEFKAQPFTRSDAAKGLATILELEGDRFDRDRFLKAVDAAAVKAGGLA